MLPNGKLIVFITKRALICYVVLSIIDLILLKQRWITLFGLTAGGLISILKFGSYSWAFGRIVSLSSNNGGKPAGAGLGVLVFALNQIFLLALLYLAYKYDPWFFTGFVAGILFVPLAIMINSITEAIGITHNNFE